VTYLIARRGLYGPQGLNASGLLTGLLAYCRLVDSSRFIGVNGYEHVVGYDNDYDEYKEMITSDEQTDSRDRTLRTDGRTDGRTDLTD